MKKIFGCILCFTLLLGSVATFAEAVTAVELYETVKNMELQLTQGDQNELIDSIQLIFEEKTAAPSQLNQLLEVSVVRLDADKVTEIVEDYCNLLITYFDSNQMTLKEVQGATDKLIGLLGKKVILLEGIDQEHIIALLKNVTNRNALLQGQVAVKYQETLNVAGLDKMLLDVERAYRIVNSGLNSYNSFKGLGRELQKQLVLLASSENVALTLEADMLARLIKDNIGVSVNHNGVIYQIPRAFLEKHIGDLKIMIEAVAVDSNTSSVISVIGATVKPVWSSKVAIGYVTNPESIKISIAVSILEEGMPVDSSYALIEEEKGQWKKLLSEMKDDVFTTTIKSTGLVSAGIYKPTYTDIAGHWAQKNSSDLLACGIAIDSNTMTYGLNDVMTRGEFVRMLINTIGTEGKSANIFTDVPVGSAYADIIESVVFYGLATGTTDNKFSPETLLTREDMVALAGKMFEIENGYKLYGGFLKFKDMNDIAPYAKDAVTAMKEAGYISGYDDNTFRPKKTVTKAEAISVLWKMLK